MMTYTCITNLENFTKSISTGSKFGKRNEYLKNLTIYPNKHANIPVLCI